MEKISKLVTQRANIILQGFDPLSAGGFTQVPNAVLENKKLTGNAKLCYAMLLKYAWQDKCCFPGQETLGEQMGASRPTVIKGLKELEKIGYLEQKRRGQGKTNVYVLYCKIKS